MPKSKESQIEEIMEEMRWGEIHSVMKLLDWKWQDSDEPPSIYVLISTAKRLLDKAWEYGDGGISATGGFRAECHCGYLRLAFEVCDWHIKPDEEKINQDVRTRT